MTSAPFSSPFGLAVAAFVIGLSGAMAPGPYLTVTITRTLREGRASALLMLVGHALLEALLLVGFAFGLQRLLGQAAVMRALTLAGGAFLVWMGGDLFLGAVRGTVSAEFQAAEESSSRLGPVAQGAFVSLSNPYWTLWWITIGVTLASQGLAWGPVGVLAFFVGHELADIAWYSAVVFAVSSGRHLLTGTVYRIVIGALALFLVFLGVRFLLQAARAFG